LCEKERDKEAKEKGAGIIYTNALTCQSWIVSIWKIKHDFFFFGFELEKKNIEKKKKKT
jgi:hypothetical protein